MFDWIFRAKENEDRLRQLTTQSSVDQEAMRHLAIDFLRACPDMKSLAIDEYALIARYRLGATSGQWFPLRVKQASEWDVH